jgi:hypothetical protein
MPGGGTGGAMLQLFGALHRKTVNCNCSALSKLNDETQDELNTILSIFLLQVQNYNSKLRINLFYAAYCDQG